MEQFIANTLVIVGIIILIKGTWATAREAMEIKDEQQSTSRRNGEHDPR